MESENNIKLLIYIKIGKKYRKLAINRNYHH